MFHLLYVTVKPETGEFYVGKHSTENPNDKYFGSGRWVQTQKAEGVTLQKTNLAFFASEVEALEAEKILVDLVRPDALCRNFTRGGRGACEHLRLYKRTPEMNKKVGEALRKLYSEMDPDERKRLKGKHLVGKKKPKLSLQFRGEGNPFWGKSHTAETKRKIAAARSSEERAAIARGNQNTRGKRWFNDGVNRYLLSVSEGEARGLRLGSIGGWKWKRKTTGEQDGTGLANPCEQ